MEEKEIEENIIFLEKVNTLPIYMSKEEKFLNIWPGFNAVSCPLFNDWKNMHFLADILCAERIVLRAIL